MTIISEVSEAGWLHGGRLFYFARLVAALLAATLIPILIDRRLRR
ncbi:MAG TPA: hypothetical protein VGL43_05665 [Casimicrobiaceae bacterium]|nr:hypothetical protein [Gemmatimonadaceae bacterium]